MTDLNSYHFSLGDSGGPGNIGYCARVRAESFEQAAQILKAVLPERILVYQNRFDETGRGIEYLDVYFGERDHTPDDQGEDDEPVPADDLVDGEYSFSGSREWPWQLEVA